MSPEEERLLFLSPREVKTSSRSHSKVEAGQGWNKPLAKFLSEACPHPHPKSQLHLGGASEPVKSASDPLALAAESPASEEPHSLLN